MSVARFIGTVCSESINSQRCVIQILTPFLKTFPITRRHMRYLFVGRVKDKVCIDNPRTEDFPAKRIPDVISSVSPAEFRRAVNDSMFVRYDTPANRRRLLSAPS